MFRFFESAGMIPVELEERQYVIECCETLALGEVSRIIESLGVPVGPNEILSSLGYEIEWNGLD